jgi:hypothetical protein
MSATLPAGINHYAACLTGKNDSFVFRSSAAAQTGAAVFDCDYRLGPGFRRGDGYLLIPLVFQSFRRRPESSDAGQIVSPTGPESIFSQTLSPERWVPPDLIANFSVHAGAGKFFARKNSGLNSFD